VSHGLLSLTQGDSARESASPETITADLVLHLEPTVAVGPAREHGRTSHATQVRTLSQALATFAPATSCQTFTRNTVQKGRALGTAGAFGDSKCEMLWFNAVSGQVATGDVAAPLVAVDPPVWFQTAVPPEVWALLGTACFTSPDLVLQ